MTKWIKCTERYPNCDTDVLIYMVDRSMHVDQAGYPKDDNVWNNTYKESVTHWMPLPSPPED